MQVTVGNLTQEELVKAVKVKETILEGMSIIERIPGIMINREWAAFSFMPCRNSHQEEIRIMVILGTSLSTVELDPYIKEAASEEIRNGLCLVLTDRRAEEINVVIRTPDSSFDGFICP